MKATKLITVLKISGFLIAVVSMISLASDQDNEKNLSHDALASQYKDWAQELLTKAEQEKAEIMRKLSASFFGKTGMSHKKRSQNKISKYVKAASDYSQKAAYHQKMTRSQ